MLWEKTFPSVEETMFTFPRATANLALPYDGTTDEGKKGLLGLISFIASLFPKGE